jgi:hypothetical protein
VDPCFYSDEEDYHLWNTVGRKEGEKSYSEGVKWERTFVFNFGFEGLVGQIIDGNRRMLIDGLYYTNQH